jgi:hypothetical protein
MKHIARCLSAMQKRGALAFEVDAAPNQSFLERMRRRLRHSVFVRGDCTPANSYYFDPNGEPSLLRPSGVARMHAEQARFPLADYHFFS